MNTKFANASRSAQARQAGLWIGAVLILSMVLSFALGARPVVAQGTTWQDDFNGSLGDGWYWINENPDRWNLTDASGFLRIWASDVPTGEQNLLLRPVAAGDFMIKTRMIFQPDTDFQIAGLVVWMDEINFIQFGRAYCDFYEYGCVGNGLYFDKIIDGGMVDGNFARLIDNPSEVYLRLEKRGDQLTAFYNTDGWTWHPIGSHWIPPEFQINAVGLTASQDYFTPEWDVPADFDFFTLEEGEGFLPEGYHDGYGGDVPDSACSAFGWAVDPDDREADILVEVVSNQGSVESVLAGEFRQDLLDTGGCVNGTCGFNVNLWGKIPSYEPNTITVYAQDIPSGDWIVLNATPKDLTCRTYDIYSYDTATGEAVQVSNMRETGEYNPTWSPNGKFVAHDVVGPEQHDIYVTNVTTHLSKPLRGASGGNDAAWAPVGSWIAFDRRWAGDESIYIVPALGGPRRLVRRGAVSAAWSPSGKRLVVQDLWDGGKLKTIDLFGHREQTIAEYGENPSWSPDGYWISFDRDGDIWKVPVTLGGAPLALPVQMSFDPIVEGSTTWSADSQWIIFSGGLNGEFEIWRLPAAGGEPEWLAGAYGFGEYDPGAMLHGSKVAYASFGPQNFERQWVTLFTGDLPGGSWSPGEHSYQFELNWTFPEPGSFLGQGGEFTVDPFAELYDGWVLLRGPREVRGVDTPDGFRCEDVPAIHPDQPTRFAMGWLTDTWITYPDAAAHFNSMTARALWDDAGYLDLGRHLILPWSQWDWAGYWCSFSR